MLLQPTPSRALERLCQRLAPGQTPVAIRHQPLPDKPLKECFAIVEEQVRSQGGKQHFGWALLELEGLWIEAEFHTVWQSSRTGEVVDLTPRVLPMEHILFLPDPTRTYSGQQVESVFELLTDHPLAHEFVRLTHEYFLALNEGELANVQSGLVRSPKAAKLKHDIEQLMGQLWIEKMRQKT